ncbi:MAG TPA: flagellar FliJ family protein [Bacteroidota bacterium]|nr:flagellar FliJ family protein [Bacteroidota bacterium]
MVLRIKKHLEKKAQGELVQAQVVRMKESEVLGRLEQTREQALDAAGQAVRTQAGDLQTESAYLFTVAREVSRQKVRVADLTGQEEAKRKELVEKSKAKKIVETLEQKKALEELKEMEKKHQGMIDMLAQRIRTDV